MSVKSEKRCFVIMPISDCEGYPVGHFGRVYSYIIQPAIIAAGFKPIRADDIQVTNYIALDVIKHIINCEMALCDLSNKNPNVLYELGIRQAFNLPVTLIKDLRTTRIFDIQGFRDVEYDETLRIDNVQDVIKELAETILNTFNKTDEINSLVSLLGIEPAKISERKISGESELILNAISVLDKRISEMEVKGQMQEEKRRPQFTFSTLNHISLSQQEMFDLKVEDRILHEKFGLGTVRNLKGTGRDKIASINFDLFGNKDLMLKFSKLYKAAVN